MSNDLLRITLYFVLDEHSLTYVEDVDRWRRWSWMRDGAAEESASSLCPAATLEGETELSIVPWYAQWCSGVRT